MKKVYSSFQEMMAVVRGKVEEYVPQRYIEPFEPEGGLEALASEGDEVQPKPKKRRRKGKEEA